MANITKNLLKTKKIGYIVAIIAMLGIFTWPNSPSIGGDVKVKAAGSASFSLSPNSGSYAVGNTFVTTIYEDSGSENTNAVEVGLRYNASHLQVVSVDASQSAFGLGVGTTNNPGYFAMDRAAFSNGTPSQLTGKQEIVKVTFKALAAANTTAITFDDNSKIASSDGNQTTNIWNNEKAASSYNLYSPPSQTTPQTPSNTPSSPSSSGSTQNSQPKTSTSTQSSPRNTSVVPSTQPSSGSDSSSGQNPQTTPQQTSSGEAVEQIEPKKGYIVVIKVLDEKGKPVQNATVKIGSENSVQSDKKGLASFTGIVPGKYKVSVLSWNKVTESTITVKDLPDPAQNLQEFEVKVSQANPITTILPTVLIAILAIVIVAIAITILKKRFSSGFRSSSPVDSSSIIASGGSTHHNNDSNNQPNQGN